MTLRSYEYRTPDSRDDYYEPDGCTPQQHGILAMWRADIRERRPGYAMAYMFSGTLFTVF
jgi:hypothetical protein